MPFHCDDDRTDRWANETLDELTQFSSHEDEHRRSLVEIVHAICLKRRSDEAVPKWTTDERLSFRYLDLDELLKEGATRRLRLPHEQVLKSAGYSHAWIFRTPIVDAPKMLTVSFIRS